MSITPSSKLFSLVQREFQEYRTSLLITPAVVGGLMILAMFISVLFANRLAFIGEGAIEVLMADPDESGLHLTISIDDDEEIVIGDQGEVVDEPQTYTVVEETEVNEEEWNFSGEWTFRAPRRNAAPDGHDHDGQPMNTAMNILHSLFLIILFFVSVNYMLGCLYQDRKDRSILFWKSMPVSEWHEVASKFIVASLLAPLAFLAASIITQLATLSLAMLLLWRLDTDASAMVLGNVDFIALFSNQMGAYFIWALWTAPVYAWFLMCSALAKRSPFMIAFGVPIAIMFVEGVFIGTQKFMIAVSHHVPSMRESDSESMGFYVYGPVWSSLDWLGMVLGLAIAAVFTVAAVWLRKHRFEI